MSTSKLKKFKRIVDFCVEKFWIVLLLLFNVAIFILNVNKLVFERIAGLKFLVKVSVLFKFVGKFSGWLIALFNSFSSKVTKSLVLKRMVVCGTVILVSWLVFSNIRAGYVQYGEASWYGGKFIGRLTSNGEIYTGKGYTAAHKTWPTGSIIMVTNLDNDKKLKVRINDKGPYAKGRIIDLSVAAAEKLGMKKAGVANVKLEMLKRGNGKYKNQQVSKK